MLTNPEHDFTLFCRKFSSDIDVLQQHYVSHELGPLIALVKARKFQSAPFLILAGTLAQRPCA